jgi:NAD(P)H-hydrate repair Nnr-like enzyme with NAD(P)H-hydrate dehydratase domain
MDNTFWHKQSVEQPLFPGLLWSRPEYKAQAGKLLIIGGNLHSFSAVAEAYGEALKAGAGAVRVILPDALQKTVARIFPEAEFAVSTPSGSFGQASLTEFLEATAWADGVLLAGDFGRNSETAVLLEAFAEKYQSQLALTGDSVDYFINLRQVLSRPKTLLVTNLNQLQKLAAHVPLSQAFTSGMALLQFAGALHEFTTKVGANVLTTHAENSCVAAGGQVSTTKISKTSRGELKLAAHASVWWLQNPSKIFEAVTTSALDIA